MPKKIIYISTFLILALITSISFSQEGHPLKGTWRASSTRFNEILIIMDWNGKEVSGMVNPGRNSVPIIAMFDPETWSVKIEYTDNENQEVAINGTLEDIGFYDRKIRGSIKVGMEMSEVLIVRE